MMKQHAWSILLTPLIILPAIAAQVDPLAPEEVPESVTPEAVAAGDAALGESNALQGDNGRIVGGERAPAGSAPWQVELFSPFAQYSKAEILADAKRERGDPAKLYLSERKSHELAHKCGGAYIGDGWVLTAAHCVPKFDLGPIDGRARNLMTDRRIRMGTQNLTAGGAVFQIERVVVHSGYEPENKPHDIAMIKIVDNGQTARLGARLKTIQLHSPAKPLFNNEDVWVYGWGWLSPRAPGTAARQSVGGTTQRNPTELQQAKLKHVSGSRCQSLYKAWGPGMLCISGAGTGRDSCQGDSGGPLVRIEGNEKVLVGIVSQGYGCAYKDMPAAYTRVSYYLGWIDKVKRTSRKGFQRL